jgi:hypothetical protein
MFPWSLIGSGVKAAVEIYSNKKKSEIVMSEAALLHAEKMKRGEIEYTGKVFENQKNDWKDEFILLTLLLHNVCVVTNVTVKRRKNNEKK